MRGEKVFPVAVEVSPCHVCNASCPWCYYSETHMKMGKDSILAEGLAQRFLEEFQACGGQSVSWTGGGEPTLWPHFSDITWYAHYALNLEQGLFTNGLLMPKYKPEVFEWIRVSNTNKPWNIQVLEHLRLHVKTLGMAVNYVGDDKVVHEALRIGKYVGVDYVQVRQALALRGHVTDRRPPAIDDPLLFITDYKFDDSSNPHGYKNCYGFNFVPFVWHDGDVDVCAYHHEPIKKGYPYTLGNLETDGGWTKIMEKAPRSVPVCASCQVCCKNHEANKYINAGLGVKDVKFP